jgi:6-phosphofructokinase 1
VTDSDFTIEQLGDCRIPSPMQCGRFTSDQEHLLYHSRYEEIRPSIDAGVVPTTQELAGPRERIYFDPTQIACGIVTCGGLCPGKGRTAETG